MNYERTPLMHAVYVGLRHMLRLVDRGTWIFIAILVFQITILATLTSQNNATAKSLVYAICQQSRQEISGASEQACGDAQDQLDVEYLCKENNSLASNRCWTEAK